VKVSEYIAEQTRGYASQSLAGGLYESKRQSLQPEPLHEFDQADGLQKSNSLKGKGQHSTTAGKANVGDKSYFNQLCDQGLSKQHKSIIPEIDFTNKYVRK
jgi:hypothetical protein